MANSILDIKKILNDYSYDIQEGIKQKASVLANEAKKEIKQVSPKLTGDYKKGWRLQKQINRYSVQCTIYNQTDYQLTHLLEKPHLKRNGKLTTPKVHISPVQEKLSKRYEKEVENLIKNGG